MYDPFFIDIPIFCKLTILKQTEKKKQKEGEKEIMNVCDWHIVQRTHISAALSTERSNQCIDSALLKGRLRLVA